MCEGGIEEGLADPGFKVLEGCIHKGVPIPFVEMFSQEHSFSEKALYEGLQIVNQT